MGRLMFSFRVIFWVTMAISVLGLPGVAMAKSAQVKNPEDVLLSGPGVSDLVSLAYQKNPMIEAAKHKWRAVIERYRVTDSYPDPQISATYFPRPIETRLGPQDFVFSLSQSIPFPGKLSQAGRIVEQEAEIARLELDKTVRDIVIAVRESFHELAYIQRAREVAAQNKALLEHLRRLGETAYVKDKASLLDVVKAQSQSGQLIYDEILLEDLAQTEQAKLNALLDRPVDASFGFLSVSGPVPMKVPLEQLYRIAGQKQEEIRIAEASVKRAEEKSSLAKYDFLPNFKIGLTYSSIGTPDVAVQPDDAGRDALGIQAGLTIPLWFGRNQGKLEEANALIRSARARQRSSVNTARAKVRAEYFKLKNAERLMKLYRTNLLPQAMRSLEIAESWFKDQQGSFSDFVEAQAVVYNFQLALARARADYGRSLARLEGLTGSKLTGQVATSVNDRTREVKQ